MGSTKPAVAKSILMHGKWTYAFILPATALLAKGSVQFNKRFLRTYYVSGPALDTEVSDPSLGGGLGL